MLLVICCIVATGSYPHSLQIIESRQHLNNLEAKLDRAATKRMENRNKNHLLLLSVAVAGTSGLILFLRRSNKEESKKKQVAPSKPILYGWKALSPYADSSPACLKLQTFFKMCKVDFDVVYFEEHQMKGCAANKKLPWIHWDQLNNGNPMGDSTLIINELIRMDPTTFNLDTHLTKEQYAIGIAFKTMLEESTYFTGLIQARWVSKDQFESITVPTYFTMFPSLLRGLIARQIRKKVIRDAQGHGTAILLTDQQVNEKFLMELDSISTFLSSHNKKYLLGDRITSFDATVFAFMTVMIQGNWNHPNCQAVRQNTTIMNYIQRIQDEYWSS